MWNWETECWGEANVAQFHQFEDELVNQCLQTPVNEEVQKAAALLGVDPEYFVDTLMKPKLKVGKDFVKKGQNKDQV